MPLGLPIVLCLTAVYALWAGQRGTTVSPPRAEKDFWLGLYAAVPITVFVMYFDITRQWDTLLIFRLMAAFFFGAVAAVFDLGFCLAFGLWLSNCLEQQPAARGKRECKKSP